MRAEPGHSSTNESGARPAVTPQSGPAAGAHTAPGSGAAAELGTAGRPLSQLTLAQAHLIIRSGQVIIRSWLGQYQVVQVVVRSLSGHYQAVQVVTLRPTYIIVRTTLSKY